MRAVDLLEEHVGALLEELGYPESFPSGRALPLLVDDQVVLLACFEQEGNTFVRVAAVLLTEVQPSLELLHHVLAAGHGTLVGAMQLFDDGTLAFVATLFGHTLDADSLGRTLRHVAHVAATEGPALAAVAGGTRWTAAQASPST